MRWVRLLPLLASLASATSYAKPRSLPLFNLVLAAGPSCTRDMDCQGSQICVSSVCQDSGPPQQPGSPDRAPIQLSHGEAERQASLLQQQISALQESRPSVVAGVVLTAIGGSVFLLGTVVLFLDVVSGVTLMVLGGIPLAIGIALWAIKGAAAQQVDLQIRALEDQKRQLAPQSFQDAFPSRIPAVTLARF